MELDNDLSFGGFDIDDRVSFPKKTLPLKASIVVK